MSLPQDYVERTYAGMLGKIIGVYLGRPFEGWSYERIQRELGEVNYYVHERFNVPLIVTDDDISGTFTFVGSVDCSEVVRVEDTDRPLTGGGIALVIEEGRMSTEEVRVGPIV